MYWHLTVMSKKKEPEIIVFQEPGCRPQKKGKQAARERDLFLSGDVSELFATVEDDSLKSQAASDDSGEIDLEATLREVQSLAATSLDGKHKRRFEEEQMRSLGVKGPKSEYVPYPHYQRVVKAKKEKERRLEEELRLRQMAAPKRKRKEQKTVQGKGRWKDNIKSLEPSIGKFKGGVLQLSKTDIVKVKRKGRTKR